MLKKKIVIIGGGPTGLGAATRLNQIGSENWELIESAKEIGGLAGSEIDPQGFTWDLGGHVIFSHYRYFDELTSFAVKDWFTHQRESWVWVENRWVPYPFQNNIHRLPPALTQECLEGLLKCQEKRHTYDKPNTFQEWIDQRFGAGIAKVFMNPYNFKVWGIPPKLMSAQWMGERVALVDIARVTKNIINNTDDGGWGPNAVFRFPAVGGTGGIWKQVASHLPQNKLKKGIAVKSVNIEKKQLSLSDGLVLDYDYLITTMPIDKFIQSVDGHEDWKEKSAKFVHSATHIIGIGIEGEPPSHLRGKCWMYFPESNCLFYRATLFSHYSSNNVPKVEGKSFWSLMLEVCESAHKPLPEGDIVQQTIDGCLATKLITHTDNIVSRWHRRLEHGYPTPFVGRDELLAELQPKLETQSVFSRGRFGGWKYEVGNQDHSLMQGVEAVDRIMFGVEEETYLYADLVNSRKSTTRSFQPGKGSLLFSS